MASEIGMVLDGVGHHFPGDPIGNDHFERLDSLDVDDAWIRRNTGVSTRHWPGAHERHVDMAERAARMALADAGLAVEDVDVVLGTSATSRPRTNPSTPGNNYMDIALPLQDRIGARRAMAMDVMGVACSGFLHASVVARGLIATGGYRTVLIACAENPEPILNFSYRNSVLFGAGAAAGVWRASAGADGLLAAALHADGSYFDAFDIDDQDKMVMKGKVVGDAAVPMLAQATEEVLGQLDGGLDGIDWIIPHQGNINLITGLRDELRLPDERVLLNIHRRGNTSSVSVPGCLSEHVHNGTIARGQRVLTMAVGRGFSWGALAFTYGEPTHA
ncbi:ketoacyl-ACP synthase III [Saccharopolyspora indica]|uniref:3-oxoacyl-ACP synthase III family protein n=1 Tax=Saccharopolyspora indica TaxID=1229659 RepID=UPI0022EAE56C|nr:ketoacyl-ACP synthase III [Saccharopolyspora indica]MDA3648110.1 ketoacyl-ACP synthase III [Saccharopolyspora indica]